MVWCGIFPADSDDYLDLKDAIAKLKLNDASLVFENDQSPAMGLGFRCGFLGLLHMDVVQERLSREYGLSLVITAPSVEYRMKWKNGEEQLIESPDKWPLQDEIPKVECFMEPYVRLEVFTPEEYVGDVMNLCLNRRGVLVDTKYLGVGRTNVVYELPLSEVIIDFFDQLKSKTRGYASMEYQVLDWRPNDLVKIDIKINGELAPPLSFICHKQMAHDRGKEITEKLKDLIPRQQFKVPIQACQGVKPIASSHISPVRKDVTAKCYGGDISRKKKLLQKQAKVSDLSGDPSRTGRDCGVRTKPLSASTHPPSWRPSLPPSRSHQLIHSLRQSVFLNCMEKRTSRESECSESLTAATKPSCLHFGQPTE
mmetsp:Transcript_2172/g.4583  ORF Transcript_2172/g.4583 Transcript_2172/m.4583 type:complete len:368 (+) Transcript_2172:136-1239(+)